MGRPYPAEVRERARYLYVVERKPSTVVAELTGVKYNTIEAWRQAERWTAQREPTTEHNPKGLGRPGHGAAVKERARGLYMAGETRERVAETLRVGVQTVRTWITKYGWAAERKALVLRQQERARARQNNTSPAQRENIRQQKLELFARMRRRDVPPPSEEEVRRAVAAFLAERAPTLCPPAYAAPLQSETIQPNHRAAWRGGRA